ncbi:MAG: hypothetical protein WD278_15755 [Pirellulales bacterium]
MDENPYESPKTVENSPPVPRKPSALATCGCMLAIVVGSNVLVLVGAFLGEVGLYVGTASAFTMILSLFLVSRWIRWRDALREKAGKSD